MPEKALARYIVDNVLARYNLFGVGRLFVSAKGQEIWSQMDLLNQ